ncbi:MAG: TIM barrel protein, partial [Anaerolineaceae bacterium]|nr:TIM barrel protein [Anaerolineaceae bacterium]
PQRTNNAGRITPGMGLPPEAWNVFTRNAEEVARVVMGETGLQTIFHHHCAGYIETPDEIERFLDDTDPSLINLVMDTGHYVFGSGSNTTGPEITAGFDRFASRIAYVHFKDCHPGIADRSRQQSKDYLQTVCEGVFCELGKGCIDFKAVVDWLNRNNYTGWVTVEQDVLPGMGSPKGSAQRNRQYLKTIGI